MTTAEARVALQRALYTSRNPTRRYLHNRRRHWVEKQIGARASAATVDSALEIGPGSGVYLGTLARNARHVVALDHDAAFLRAIREESDLPVWFVQGDLRSPPLAPRSLDLVLCSEVIEHVPESPELLSAMAALLAPDGTLLLTTPQPFSPLEVLGKVAFLPGVIHLLRWIYREPIEPTGHINLLGRRALEAQIRQAGLAIVEREVMGLYLPLIAEFGGRPGQRFLAWMERLLARTGLRGILWNQCYVLRRDHP